jgi:transposase
MTLELRTTKKEKKNKLRQTKENKKDLKKLLIIFKSYYLQKKILKEDENH